jgi:tetratricopeptide (TPR) repeat protein
MDALISGQAGVAILIQGNEITTLGIEDGRGELRYAPAAIPYLLAGANDVVEINSTSRRDVLGRLKLSWQFDRALQLTLIALDRSEEVENRRLSIECLSELFGDHQVLESVGNRLYSAPLPEGSDLEAASLFAQGCRGIEQFFRDLHLDQGLIQRVRNAWDSIPVSHFDAESAKQEFLEAAITAGAFRLLARAHSDPAAFGLATIQCHQNLMTLPNYRKILQAWTSPLKPRQVASAIPEPSDIQKQSSREHANRHQPHARFVSTHELFENVKKQKQAIVDLLKKDDIAHVRAYADQLIESQLRTGGPEYAAMSLCDLAQEAKAIHNYSLQVELAQKAVEVAPEDGWAHGQVADAYVCLGQYDNALKSFQLAATFGQPAFAACGRARVLRAIGRLDESLAAFEQVIAAYPEENTAWYGRAEVLRDMWKLDDALHAYDLAIQTFPAEIVPRCGKAAVLKDMGHLDESLNSYDDAIEKLGDDVVPLCGRADVLKELGRLDQALTAYDHAIGAFPTECIPKCGRAEVLKEMGKLDEALEAYSDVAAAFQHDVVPLSGRAETLKRMRRFEQALTAYEDALQRFPDERRLRNGRADVLKRLGRLRDALRTYDDNIKRSPYDIIALSGRADVLKELGELKEAVAAYGVLMTRNPSKQSIRNAKAAVLTVLCHYEEALKLLPVGDPHTREEWIAQHIRGMIFLRRGKLDLALKLFEVSVARIPFASERRYFENALAVAKLRMKKFDEAVKSLGQDREPLTNVLRMHAFGGMQRLGEARDILEKLESNCPRNLVRLKNELAARYKLSRNAPRHDVRWVFDEECRGVLLEAA